MQLNRQFGKQVFHRTEQESAPVKQSFQFAKALQERSIFLGWHMLSFFTTNSTSQKSYPLHKGAVFAVLLRNDDALLLAAKRVTPSSLYHCASKLAFVDTINSSYCICMIVIATIISQQLLQFQLLFSVVLRCQ